MLRPPKPRLRQVFEHTTSFKVTGPSGKTITIAKKGLSPSTVGRLRRFAQGGEVQNYQVGGEISLPSDESLAEMPAPGLGVEASQVPAPPAAAEREVPVSGVARFAGPRRPVKASEATAPDSETQDRQYLEYAKWLASKPETPASMAPVAPAAAPVAPAVAPESKAPVQIIVQAPQPAAPQPAPQEMKAAPVVEEKIQEAKEPAAPAPAPEPAPTAPVPRFDIPPLQLQRPTMMDVSSAMQPMTPPEAGRGIPMPLEIPQATLPVSGMEQPKPFVSLEPVAAPVAAAPAAPVAPAPVVALMMRGPLTGAMLADAAAKEPTKTIEQLVVGLTGADPMVVAQTIPGIKDFPGLTLAEGADPNVRKILMDAAVTGANGIIDAANASLAEQTAELDIAKAEEIRAAAIAKQSEENLRQLTKNADEKLKAAEASDDLRPFLGGEGSTQGWGRSIASIFALAVGGFLSGYTNTPNYVLKAFNDAMDRDIEEQKRKRTSMWNRYNDVLKNKEAASLMVRADNNVLAQAYYKKMLATQDLGKVRPQAEKMLGELQRQLALDLSKVSGMMALEEFREAEAVRALRPPVVRPAAGLKGPREATPTELLRRQKYEEGRTVSVEGVPVQRNTDAGAANVTNELNGRNTAAESLVQLVDLFDKSTPEEAINLLGDKRAKLLAGVNYAVENFPMAFGYKRAVSVNAANVLKAGIDNPTGLKAYLLALAGGRNIATGLRELKDEVLRARDTYVRSLASTDKRDREAAELGLWRLASKEAALVKTKAPSKPKLDVPEDELLQTPYQRGLVMPATVGVSPVVPLAALGAPAPAAVAPPEAPAPSGPRKKMTREELLKLGTVVPK